MSFYVLFWDEDSIDRRRGFSTKLFVKYTNIVPCSGVPYSGKPLCSSFEDYKFDRSTSEIGT
jgi:hypothetical protein